MLKNIALLVCVGLAPQAAWAQGGIGTSCGGSTSTHTMRQVSGVRAVEVVATTTRTYIGLGCVYFVQTEAWVNGVGPAANSGQQGMVAKVQFTIGVPSYRTWQSTAKHWLITFGLWQNMGDTWATANVVPTSTGTCVFNPNCPEGTDFKGFPYCTCQRLSPILIDTAGDGYRLTSAAAGVVFDLDANGNTVEQIAWTEPDSDDAWLALDRNGNGRIDDGSELFGSRSPAYADHAEPWAANGFDALQFLQGPSYGASYGDARVDARDAMFAQLRLWFDRNHNGVSDAGELVPLAEAGIVALETTAHAQGRRDQYGNLFALRGRVWHTVHGQLVPRPVYDVFLTVAP